MLTNLSKLSHKDKLKKFNLPTLVYRRLQIEMIEIYKLLSCSEKKKNAQSN